MQNQKDQFVSKLRREYRGFKLRMTLLLVALTGLTIKIIYHILTQDALQSPRSKYIDLSSEWALIPFLALPWGAAIYFVRIYLKHRRSHPNYDQSIPASLRAMADSTAAAIKRIKILISLYLVGIPICGLIISQIQQAGKIRPHELLSMVALFSIITLIALSAFAFQYFRNLLPRKRQMEALLQSYPS